MKKTILLILSLYCSLLVAQNNNTLVQRSSDLHNRSYQDFNTPQAFSCGNEILDMATSEEFKMSCSAFYDSYGTNSWQPTSNSSNCNIDSSCDIPSLPHPNYNGGLYRVPIHFTIFEDHNAANFTPLADSDIDAIIASTNEIYKNSKIEFYEAKQRLRVENSDFYDFHFQTVDSDGTQDANINNPTQLQYFQTLNQPSPLYYTPDVINLYIVNHIDSWGGFAGFATTPNTVQAYGVFEYLTITNPASKTNLYHELGHVLGLKHTHADSNTSSGDVSGIPDGSLNNSDCRTKGDKICDTWPDPQLNYNCGAGNSYPACSAQNISTLYPCYLDQSPFNNGACTFNDDAYECINGSPLSISPNSGADCGNNVSTVLINNMMSYNYNKSCKNSFTPCQYRKMHDVLLDCLSNLCYQDPSHFFTEGVVNATNAPYKQIIVGEPLPTYHAGNENLTQFYWFENQGDVIADAVHFGSSFTPTIDNAVGNYTFWIADANTISDPPCKSPITLEIWTEDGQAASVPIKLKAMLHGAYNTVTNEMRTSLRQKNLIPTSQPFNTSPWNYTGNESLINASSIPLDVVDWVLLEARDVNDNFIILDSKAAFILKNGNIVDAHNPNSGQVIFNNILPNQAYYIVVRARTQVAVISSTPIMLPNSIPFDFTKPENVLDGMTQLYHLEDNLYGLKAGDFDHNGITIVTDYNYYKTFLSTISEYNDGDTNRDGHVTVTDYNIFKQTVSAIGTPQIRYQ